MMYRWLKPKKVLVYFAIFLIAILWLMHNLENLRPQSRKSVLPVKQDIYAEEFKILEQRSEELNNLQKRLSYAEKELRQRFPDQIDSIFNKFSSLPRIYAITPTYARPVQKAELTRLINNFFHVPNFHWIVIEDHYNKTKLVTNLLSASGLKYTHINAATPKEYKLRPKDPSWSQPRGVLQRNKGLSWLRQNLDLDKDRGVVYFADDDNTYDLKLFEEMRYTSKVSVWPVGLVGYLWYERPIVHNNKVTGWFTAWKPERLFAMDMAGFAVNLRLFLAKRDVEFSNLSKTGCLESDMLSGLEITRDDLEPKADNCSKILVWHTRTEKPSLKNEQKLKDVGRPGSDPNIEV